MGFIRALLRKIRADGVTDAAGALAFRAMLALFPLLIGIVTLAGFLVDPSVIEDLIQQIGEVAPPEVTRIVGDQLKSIIDAGTSGILTVSFLGAYWAASSGTTALIRALNRVNEVYDERPWWKTRGMALIATFFLAGLFLIAALIAVVAPAVARGLGGALGTAVTWLRLPAAGALAVLAWEVTNYFLPDVKRPFRWISWGSATAVLLWLAASWGFSTYVENFGRYELTYGALASVIVLLLWLWISALSLLLGTEINVILEQRRSGDRGDPAGRPRAG